jgi:hypothetical protein
MKLSQKKPKFQIISGKGAFLEQKKRFQLNKYILLSIKNCAVSNFEQNTQLQKGKMERVI